LLVEALGRDAKQSLARGYEADRLSEFQAAREDGKLCHNRAERSFFELYPRLHDGLESR